MNSATSYRLMEIQALGPQGPSLSGVQPLFLRESVCRAKWALSLIACVTLSACAVDGPAWNTLPVEIEAATPELDICTRDAVALLNASLGNVFVVGAAGAPIRVECDAAYFGGEMPADAETPQIIGTALRSVDESRITSCVAKLRICPVSANYCGQSYVELIAHELFHCLGFTLADHALETPCVFNAQLVFSGDEFLPVCPEMVDLFNSRYGDLN